MAEQNTELQRSTNAAPPAGKSTWPQVGSVIQERWQAMPKPQRSRLVVLTLIVLALAGALSWYSSRTSWKVLFSGLDAKDVQAVSQELSAAGITARISNDGSEVMVPEEMLDKARMEVASKGMPQSGRMGFEIFDKPNWVGSEFDEKVNYQRAMEGELERTIATLGSVRSARVHLAMAKQSLFATEEHPAKATVVLKLRRAHLPEDQAESVRNLVAGAVENLQPDQVTLVDADGRISLSASSETAQQRNVVKQIEQELITMLEPIAGRENVRATVHAEYLQASEEKTDEVYDPALSATVSMERTEQIQGSTPRTPSGVPGTQSNAPGGQQGQSQGNVPPLMQGTNGSLPVYPQATSGTNNNSRQESASYAVTRHLTHTAEGPGRLRRLTVAVLVNDRPIMEGAGKTAHMVWKQRSPDEMRRLEQLAQAAAGFDAKRGDQLVLENVSFQSNGTEAALTPVQRVTEVSQQVLRTPGILRTVALVILGSLLVVMVLRPMVKHTAELMKKVMEPIPSTPMAALAGVTPPLLSQGDGTQAPVAFLEDRKKEQPREEQVIFDQVKQQIRQEPKTSTRLLEHWISGNQDDD